MNYSFSQLSPQGHSPLTLCMLNKSWKEKLCILDFYIAELQCGHINLLQLDFQTLLQEKNVNILRKISRLMEVYVEVGGAQCFPFQKILANMFQLCRTLREETKNLFALIFRVKQANNPGKQMELLEILWVLMEPTKEGQFLLGMQIYKELLGRHRSCQLGSLKLLMRSLSAVHSPTAGIQIGLYQLFDTLTAKLGYNAVLMARKSNLSPQLIERVASQAIRLNASQQDPLYVEYTMQPGSPQWLQEYQYLPVKNINTSLAEYRGQGILLTEGLLRSLLELAKRKNDTTNRLIYDMLANNYNNISRPLIADPLLFDLLFEMVSSPRVHQLLEKDRRLHFCLKGELLLKKVKEVGTQQQYHCVIRLFERMDELSMVERVRVYNQMSLKDLSRRHRVKIDQLIKNMVRGIL